MLRNLTFRRYNFIDATWLVFCWPAFSENIIGGLSLVIGGIMMSATLEVCEERGRR